MERKMDMKKTYFLGFGFFAILHTWTLYNAIIPLMLGKYIVNPENNTPNAILVTEANETIIGAIMTIDNILAVLLLPLIGIYSDKITTKIGKRMPFLVVGMPLAALFLILLPIYDQFAFLYIHPFIILMFFITFFNLSMSIFRSPVISLMPDITPEKDRSKANAIVNFVGGVGAVLASAYGFIYAFLKIEDEYLKYLFMVAGIMTLISFFILFINIKEKRDVIAYENQENRASFIECLKEGIKTKQVFFILLAVFAWFMAYNGIETYFTRYGVNFLGITGGESVSTLFFISAPFLIFALPAGIIGTKIGKKKAMAIGLTSVMALSAVIVIFPSLWVIRIAFILMGSSWALVNINSFPFVANLSPLGKIGTYTGLYYFASMFGQIVSPPLLGGVIDLFGYGAMFIYSAIFFLVALVLVLSLKEENEYNIQGELDIL